MEQYIGRELKEDTKYLIKRIAELNEKIEKVNKMDINKKKINKDIKLLDNFDWVALGLAAVGVVILIKIIVGSI